MPYCLCGLLPFCQANTTLCEYHLSILLCTYVSADITVTCKLQQIIDITCCYAGDDVQGACYAVPFSGQCYAFVAVPSFQVYLKRLGQCCADCLLFHSRHCCSLVSSNIIEQAFAEMQTLSAVLVN
jgi:hypothetical protein